VSNNIAISAEVKLSDLVQCLAVFEKFELLSKYVLASSFQHPCFSMCNSNKSLSLILLISLSNLLYYFSCKLFFVIKQTTPSRISGTLKFLL
jgi:hypothetical protein